jgi:NAD(P)-dependent dehydrogenase (short-subunit alcohol dehydrogenase family)
MALDPSAALLSDRVALVTGAAVGIGRAISLAFARFGADLALCDRDGDALAGTVQAAEALGRRVDFGVFDVREASDVIAFVERVAGGFGRLDVLVNNAGGGFSARFLDVSAKGEDALVRENFTSVGHLVRAVAPHFPERGGSIVNITSIEAHRAGPGYAVYSAMKAAVENLTRSLALELGERRIRVNCIAPDAIPTPGIGDVQLDTPLAIRGCPDDVAGAAVFLASDLSRFVTGSTIFVDGGNRAAGGWRRGPDGEFQV